MFGTLETLRFVLLAQTLCWLGSDKNFDHFFRGHFYLTSCYLR